MKVLQLGYSDIARRRVLPALWSAGVEAIEIASESASDIVWPNRARPRRFGQYAEAIAESDADVVYISTVNSLHAELAQTALEQGFHVIVDKPAFLSLKEASTAVSLARDKNLCLAEATVYAYHPKFDLARRAFDDAHDSPTRAVAVFSMPPRPQGNFRNVAALGGGALWDLGPYAVTPGRIFFHAPSESILSRSIALDEGVETAFDVIAAYAGGRSLAGSFGWTTSYLNRLDVMGSTVTVTMDRAFSTPPDMATELTIRSADRVQIVTVPPADTFYLFFVDVFDALTRGTHSRFADVLLADAREMEILRRGTE